MKIKNMKTTIKNIFFIVTVVFISLLYYKKYYYGKVIESLAVEDKNQLTTADRWKQSITKLLKDLNYPIERRNDMMLKEPTYFFNKMEKLNNEYRIVLKRNKQDFVNYKLDPRNINLGRKYEGSTNELQGIQGDFHSLASDFVVDASKLETFINRYDEKIKELMQENKMHSDNLQSLKGSDVTAKQMYSDYKSIYKMSYRTIMLTSFALIIFLMFLYFQLKNSPTSPGADGQSEPFMKKYIKTVALAFVFAIVFSLVYNAVVDFINQQRGKKSTNNTDEITIADIPSYSFSFEIIDKTKEEDVDDNDYIRNQ